MIALWMGYAILVAFLAGLAALGVERIALLFARPARGVWGMVLAASVCLPMAAWLPDSAAQTPVASGGSFSMLELSSVQSVTGTLPLVPADGTISGEWLLGSWLLASLGVAGGIGLSAIRLARRRRQWQLSKVEGADVLLSGTAGPAVVGLIHPRIVLPRWTLQLEARQRQLLVRHEREHLRARDPWLLMAGLAALVIMPWNPGLWWQVRRLRVAVEMDCDARVLRAAGAPASYGRLLLEACRRGGRVPLAAPGLSLFPSTLERRIRQMMNQRPDHRTRRAVLTLVPVILVVGLLWSCEAPPVGVPERSEEAAPTPAADAQDDDGPRFTPYEVAPELRDPDALRAALTEAYPAELRDAGVEGTTHVWLHIDEDGHPADVRVSESSGNDRLDAAALRVLEDTRFTPAVNRDERVAVWVQFPVSFRAADA